MGIDFNSIFGQVNDAVAQATADIRNVGVPALEASLEKWGADKLNEMAGQSQKKTDAAVKTVLARPTEPGGFGSYLANTMQSPLIKQYGTPVAIGAAILVLFFVMRR
jgi:hypothetical protein